MSGAHRRQAVTHMLNNTQISERRACQLAGLNRMTWRYQPVTNCLNQALGKRLCELAKQRLRFGSPRLTVLIRREFGTINHKRIERLYATLGLQIPRRKRRSRVGPQREVPLERATRPMQRWSMDFVHDTLCNGAQFRVFNFVDEYTREAIAVEVGSCLGSERIIRVFERIKGARGLPAQLVCDNGSEFTSRAFLAWSQQNNLDVRYIRPGKPTENAFVESYNGKLRDECLNQHWFYNLEEARQRIEQWRDDYNHYRPHRSLNQLTPMEFTKLTQPVA